MLKHLRPLLLVALFSSMALAHTQITNVSPALGSTTHAPKNVHLVFDEPVNLHFSTIKVYALPRGQTAVQYAKVALSHKECDAQRIDKCPNLNGLRNDVVLPLKNNIQSGVYIIIWRLLSDDGHIVEGQGTFRVIN